LFVPEDITFEIVVTRISCAGERKSPRIFERVCASD
jgi:hypothetical protein